MKEWEPLAEALRILGRFWLEEVQPHDLKLISALPELARTLPKADSDTLSDLAVEYQRLLGFNLPPYESVFIDPTAMLMAPATQVVQMLYRQAEWTPPADARAGALDHLGLELLALANWLDEGRTELARRLQTRHLALWVPAFSLALRRLAPHPFYAELSNLTLGLLLGTLPLEPIPSDTDPFPRLPPPQSYQDQGMPSPSTDTHEEMTVGLRDVVRRLLTPHFAGMYMTRQDIAHISRVLDLPGVMGERSRMLETLFRLAGQYELIPALFDQLTRLLEDAGAAYQTWADEYPVWAPYAHAWRCRVASVQLTLNKLMQVT